MDFIYRIPLIDFDPSNPSEIIRNWVQITDTIHYSSPELFQQIHGKDYDALSEEIKLSIYKYLLRGRYRATPFGKWAAVGTGRWDNTKKTILDLDTKQILPIEKKPTNQENYTLAPGLEPCPPMIRYLQFDQKEQKWIYSLIAENKILNTLIRHFEEKQLLDFREFSTWFSGIDRESKLEIWNRVLATGIILKATREKQHSNPQNINLKALETVFLDPSIREKLDMFTKQSGKLFTQQKKPILEKFKNLFQAKFDDRFVSLHQLMCEAVLLQESLAAVDRNGYVSSSKLPNLFPGINQIDLSQEAAKEQLPDQIHDIQYLFRVDAAGRILMDNIVCNRPFVYSGRFSEDQQLFQFIKDMNPELKNPISFRYCDIQLMESDTIQFLCRHQNCYSHQLGPIQDQETGTISLKEVYLGIHEDRILLYWKKKNIVLLPVFQHPLNGQQISLNLFRLLWEISNQDSFKFLPYTTGQTSRYYPEYRWGNIILQPRKWIYKAEEFSSIQDLKNSLQEDAIPDPVQVGTMDQELVLYWKNPLDLKILWKELNKREKLHLLEAVGYDDPLFYSGNGKPVFPQIVYQSKVHPPKVTIPGLVNYLDEQDPSCLYFRIGTSPQGLITLLKKTLPSLIHELKRELPTLNWYFLIYGMPKLEVRIRFLRLKAKQKAMIRNVAYGHFQKDPQLSLREATYYPEFEKYGITDQNKSNQLFQWESELVLQGNKENSLPLICWEEEAKVDLFSEIWSEVFFKSSLRDVYLEEFKMILKTLSTQDIRKIRKSFDPTLSSKAWKGSTQTYLQCIQKHRNYQNTTRQKSFLLNHFHMMANRFFLMNAMDYEEICRYVTYRKLGRKIHMGS
ncbi:lantibiotic dehydratase [Algoriphagus pacificus]|uniref:Lantibiotic dehydratase n=1 Tax=Algoriphagus pacificus TaxID=2811234 RepID=A0ABS3CII3_9BACT|nr:lantibiotic dehydratase [Algoriphagus pacificus]MBN7816907.1 lantibiotic dehydratase [Algoriphagus pacificus]